MNRLRSAKTLAALLAATACGAKATDAKWLSSADPPPKSTVGHVDDSLPQNSSGINKNPQIPERKVLPPELSKNVVQLTCESSAEGGVCEVYLVGTCDCDCPENWQLVEDVIKFLKPEVVFLESCYYRADDLMPNAPKDEGGAYRVAFDEARKYGAMVALGDQPLPYIMGRLWDKIRLWPFPNLWQFRNLCKKEKEIIHLDEINLGEIAFLIEEWSKLFPNVVEVVIHERGKYMSASLLKVARERNLVVAIVGHLVLPGICNNWNRTQIPGTSLEAI